MVLIENVRGITYDFIDGNDEATRRNFANDVISRLGEHYHVYSDTLRCSMFGVPQQRPRFFLVGMLKAEGKLPGRENPFARLRASRVRFLDERRQKPRVTSKEGDLGPGVRRRWHRPVSGLRRATEPFSLVARKRIIRS